MEGSFLREAAILRIAFNHVQISVHCPTIRRSTSPNQLSPLSLPNLAICATAARSTSRVLEACLDMNTPPMLVNMAFVSGLVLMIGLWEIRRRGLNVDESTQLADVQKCIRFLSRRESR